MALLLLDIGSGTQDVLLVPDEVVEGRWPLENCPKFVLPSPAQQVAARIRRNTAQGLGVHLHGEIMGGGFFRALKAHLEAGVAASATLGAALSLFDDPARLEGMGVAVQESCPAGHQPLWLGDFSWQWWEGFLAMSGIPMPGQVVAAAQDHGFHPEGNNRMGRFALWHEFLTAAEGRPEALLFGQPPGPFTRLETLHRCIGGGPVTDTGAAAVLGALFDPSFQVLQARAGACVLNCGNSHLIAFLVFDGRIWGVYEHHTGLRSREELLRDVQAFCAGELDQDTVHASGGHGCLRLPSPAAAQGFPHLVVLGPQRGLLAEEADHFSAPGGDMMLAGCFGLLQGLRLTGRLPRWREGPAAR